MMAGEPLWLQMCLRQCRYNALPRKELRRLAKIAESAEILQPHVSLSMEDETNVNRVHREIVMVFASGRTGP